MKKVVCKKSQCTGCHACAEICPTGAIELIDDIEFMYAEIDPKKCVECKRCYSVCPNQNPVKMNAPIEWYQGWSRAADRRAKSASGGYAAEITKAFIREGGVVVSCIYDQGVFSYKLVEREEEAIQFIGSKYVKSNPQKVYRATQKQLECGRNVLFIGLPCHVAAMKNYVGSKLQEKLVTVDLICHGTPSTKLLNIFIEQHGEQINSLKSIKFREKNDFRLWVNAQTVTDACIQDRYTLAFLRSLIYTENCYRCQFAKFQRVGDITLGDSWGSELSETEQKKGISLALCQTEKGAALLKKSDVVLEAVDFDKACKNNQQLCHPAVLDNKTAKFFKRIRKGINFDQAVAYAYPYVCMKQNAKIVLMKLIRFMKR